jgi:hypothetical protein
VRIEYRWPEGDYDRLPAIADEPVKLRVNTNAQLSALTD